MKVRAFVLDDDLTVRNLVSTLLERRGYETYAFSDAAECHKRIEDRPKGMVIPRRNDLVVSDVNMPHMNGIEFANYLSDRGHLEHRIALMSGLWKETDLKKVRNRHYKILRKPFSIKDLSSWLDFCEAEQRQVTNQLQGAA